MQPSIICSLALPSLENSRSQTPFTSPCAVMQLQLQLAAGSPRMPDADCGLPTTASSRLRRVRQTSGLAFADQQTFRGVLEDCRWCFACDALENDVRQRLFDEEMIRGDCFRLS
ncbi:hypothetical protein KC322_g34 [Hortaea werneckii]|nr:hypothetical protein KC322_g34 [Hortaea werneckii]